MCDKQCANCECSNVIDVIYSPERAKVMKSMQRKNTTPFGQSFAFMHQSIDNYGQKGVTVTHISDYSPEKQAEWAAVQPYDKDAYKGMETLAPQRKISAFKDAVKESVTKDAWSI